MNLIIANAEALSSLRDKGSHVVSAIGNICNPETRRSKETRARLETKVCLTAASFNLHNAR